MMLFCYEITCGYPKAIIIAI